MNGWMVLLEFVRGQVVEAWRHSRRAIDSHRQTVPPHEDAKPRLFDRNEAIEELSAALTKLSESGTLDLH